MPEHILINPTEGYNGISFMLSQHSESQPYLDLRNTQKRGLALFLR